jgi:hypothetical protein
MTGCGSVAQDNIRELPDFARNDISRTKVSIHQEQMTLRGISMSDKERPLPKPPNKAFGRKNKFEEQEEQGTLLADRMAAAAAEGKLNEFLKQEMPDNEYARNLASMMMGMTGVMPNMTSPLNPSGEKQEEKRTENPAAETGEQHPDVPEDVRSAIMGGDIQGLMNLLRREHEKRNPDSQLHKKVEEKPEGALPQQPQPGLMPTIDRETIDSLVKIALENSVTLDWIILRAIKLYVQEYQKTGRL